MKIKITNETREHEQEIKLYTTARMLMEDPSASVKEILKRAPFEKKRDGRPGYVYDEYDENMTVSTRRNDKLCCWLKKRKDLYSPYSDGKNEDSGKDSLPIYQQLENLDDYEEVSITYSVYLRKKGQTMAWLSADISLKKEEVEDILLT